MGETQLGAKPTLCSALERTATGEDEFTVSEMLTMLELSDDKSAENVRKLLRYTNTEPAKDLIRLFRGMAPGMLDRLAGEGTAEDELWLNVLTKTSTDPRVEDILLESPYVSRQAKERVRTQGVRVRMRKAMRIETAAAKLAVLAKNPSARVKSHVISHANVDEAVLAHLGKDKDPYMRWAVAQHERTTSATM